MVEGEVNAQGLHTQSPPGAPADAAALKELYAQYNQNTEKLRLAFERLERRFREIDPYNIYNSITEALITLDRDENILTCNAAAERIFELNAHQAAGRSFRDALPMCVRSFEDHAERADPGARYEIHFRNSGGDPMYLRGRYSPLLDRNGDEIGYTCLFTDHSVERLLEEKARRQDRLTALGELAAGVAHEMRNPLTTIRGYLQILPDNKDDDEFIHEFSDNLIREIDRLTRLTDNLLNMAKPISPELRRVCLSETVTAVADFLADKLKSGGVSVEIEESAESFPVRVDVDRIRQVFINLFVNAAEAMSDGGRVFVRLSRRTETFSSDEDPTVFVVAEVADNGPGIPPQLIDRLFDPFFTTKDTGTGLGLSLTNRIVEEHGGFIRVESAAGEGARFWVFLPEADESKG
ncbi:MAG: PAS domain-containing protein [bacterium]|nr:PAS domain-containing protein [bacterium]